MFMIENKRERILRLKTEVRQKTHITLQRCAPYLIESMIFVVINNC